MPAVTVMTRLFWRLIIAFLAMGASASSEMIRSTESLGTTFERLKIGAGGFLTGLNIAADGTKVVRTDTYGAYLFDANAGGVGSWHQLVSVNSMPAGDVHWGTDQAVYEIAIAPSNTQHLYMVFNGYVYTSTNRGARWARTSFKQDNSTYSGGNNDKRYFGRFMAVDPANENVVYVGTQSNLFVTTDGGINWSTVSSIAVPAPAYNPTTSAYNGAYAIAFDPSSSIVGGTTQGIYVSSYGTGVYHSTDGGSSWSLTVRTPTTHRHMACGVDGVLWLTDNGGSGTNAWRYKSGTWTNLSVSSGQGWSAVAADPANAGHIYLVDNGGNLAYSANNGSNFTAEFTYATQIATDIPWLANSPTNNNAFMAVGDAAFDPSVSNTLWVSTGEAVWRTNPPTSATSFTWTSQSSGIEQLVANWILSPPNGTPIGLVSDKVGFQFNNLSDFPSKHIGASPAANPIVHSRGGDWASSTPSTIVIMADILDYAGSESAVSSDGGSTWTKWVSTPTGVPTTYPGGSLAASTPDKLGSNSVQPYSARLVYDRWSSQLEPSNDPRCTHFR